MKKRILSLLLAFLMVVSIFPAPAYATDSTDVTITPSETTTETASEAACPTCGTVGCTSEHLAWCPDCKVDDCGKTHVYCETCQVNDCGVDHSALQPCVTCGSTECDGAHDNWCADCKTDNCGKAHVYCETCQKNDCGADHNATEPTEAATEPVAAINEEETTNPMVGKQVKIASGASMVWPLTEIPNGTTVIANTAEYAEVMVVMAVETVNGTTYYQLKAADGYSWPANSKVQDGYWLDSTKLEVVEAKDPCDICGEYDCGKTHVWCETCGKYDCGIEHEDTTPSISATVTDADGNDQTVTVSGDALPEGVTLNVQTADVSTQLNKFGVSESAKVFGLDISVLLADDSQWQPAAGSSVKVKIPVDVTVGTTIGLLHTHEGVTSYIGMTEVLSDGTVEFYTDGFSEFAGFTVDFHYNGVDFSIEGLTSILLSELFAAMGIEEDATKASSVVFSDNDLVGVDQQSDGDWLLTSLDAFSTEETLIITFNDGHTIVIDVTDIAWNPNEELFGGIASTKNLGGSVTNTATFYLYYSSGPNSGRTGEQKEEGIYLRAVGNTTIGFAQQSEYWHYVSASNATVSNDGLRSVSGTGSNTSSKDSVYIDRISTSIISNDIITVRQQDYAATTYESRTVVVKINGKTEYSVTTNFPTASGANASTQIVVSNVASNYYYSGSYSYSDRVYTIELLTLHTVKWVNWDGTALKTDTNVKYGSTPAYNSATPTKAATAEYTYTFAGWSPAVSAVTGDVTYTATYTATKNKYTITWKNDDGTVIDTTSVAYGDVPTHANPTKAATAEYTYTFAGWTPTVAAVTGNATYTATYTASKNKYTVTVIYDDGQVDANGLDGYTQTDGKYQKLVEYNSVVALEFEPKTGYQITEVKLGSDTIGTFTGTINQPITSHTTITVTSSPITYTVKYDGNPTSYGTTSDSTHTYGVAKSLTANGYDRSGYKFVGWNTEANGSGTSYADQESVTNLSDTNGAIVTLYAQWLPIYKITLDSQNQTTEADNFYFVYTQNTYYSDNVCTTALTDNKIELPSKNGYSFAGYYTGTNGSGTQYIDKDGNINSDCCQLNADTTLYAKWDIITYTITYQYNDGVTPDSTVNYNYETSIQLQVPERLGYKFLGWTNQSKGETTNNWKYTNYDYTTDGMQSPGNHQYGNVILIARWNPIEYNISYALNGGDLGEGITNPKTYTIETDSFTLNNPSREGYKFLGWATSAEATSGTDPLIIKKGTTGNLTYYAIWKRALVDLTITTTSTNQDQSFLFTVSGTPSDSSYGTITLDVVLVGTDSITIKDLPVGTYTVTEKDGWSWRETTVESQQVTLTTESKAVAFTFGAVDRIYWLSDYSYKRRKGGS